MEFNEKLQSLRKRNSLTQQQLADRLNISRTAVSKWESGRGFPNIQALKNISSIFDIPVDDLLSAGELLDAAEESDIQSRNRLINLFFGLIDILFSLFFFLPLFGELSGGYIRAVNLIEITAFNYLIFSYYIQLGVMIVLGITEIAVNFTDRGRNGNLLRTLSILIHSAAVLLFTASREPYVTAFLFMLLMLKAALLFKKS